MPFPASEVRGLRRGGTSAGWKRGTAKQFDGRQPGRYSVGQQTSMKPCRGLLFAATLLGAWLGRGEEGPTLPLLTSVQQVRELSRAGLKSSTV